MPVSSLSSHNSLSTRTWLEDHLRLHHTFIPVGACWLNLQEGWWRIFRKTALAGRSSANRDDIEYVMTWRPPSSTPVPNPGSGADRPRQLADYDADMCTPFGEPSTSEVRPRDTSRHYEQAPPASNAI
jgi:hypothetical protein